MKDFDIRKGTKIVVNFTLDMFQLWAQCQLTRHSSSSNSTFSFHSIRFTSPKKQKKTKKKKKRKEMNVLASVYLRWQYCTVNVQK